MRWVNLAARHWKVGAATIAGVLWCFGLADQLESTEMTARYVGISLALVAVAAI